jgi:arylsulfatase A-like enzyme
MNVKPNIIVIILDCVRAGHLSCYGYHRETTPNLDQIATQSALFENAFTVAPWTVPSIASLFTGTLPSKHLTNLGKIPLNPNYVTIAEVLKSMGYKTMAYSNNVWISQRSGFNRGFDIFEEIYSKSHSPKDSALQKLVRLKNKIEKIVLNHYDHGAYITNKKVKAWLSKYFTKTPFFLYIHYMECHEPYWPPKPFNTLYAPEGFTVRALKRVNQYPYDYLFGNLELNNNDFEILQALYDGSLSYLDCMIGDFFRFLKEREIIDQTILIIMADHGQNNGEHNLLSHTLCLYDTLLHIPLIIRAPRFFPAGLRISQAVQTIDIFPTILDILGIESEAIWKQLQGRSIFSILEGDSPPFLIAEYFKPSFEKLEKEYPRFDFSSIPDQLKAIRVNNFKYIWSSKEENELYNLSDDPEELNNLIEIFPEKANKLKTMLLNWAKSFPEAQYNGQVIEFDEPLRKKLRDLGYIS